MGNSLCSDSFGFLQSRSRFTSELKPLGTNIKQSFTIHYANNINELAMLLVVLLLVDDRSIS
jgi:hypothetical protein